MELIKAFSQQLDPLHPLRADETNLYVDWQKELFAAEDLKPRLVREIDWSGTTPITRLLTGHRGTGKTTELFRIQKMLNERKVFVSFLECEKWLDLNDVHAPDLILQMVRQLLDDLKRAGCSFAFEKVKGFFGELSEILSADVQLKDLDFNAGLVKVGIALKQVPGARVALRKFLEDRLPTIFSLVNTEILGPARKGLLGKGYEDILIMVDELDRIPQKQLSDHGVTNHEQLFLNSGGVLRALECDVIYTIPIELAYSHCHGRLATEYGGEVATLPMIPVNPAGVALLKEIVRRRAETAGVRLPDVFEDPGDLDWICRSSGGHVRSLFMLLRAALSRFDDFPMGHEIVGHAVRRQASDFGKMLNPDQWKALARVHAEHTADADLEQWIIFLRERYVYPYYSQESDGVWYDWNPLLAEVKR